jgi:ketosteroid isomerase-like protein
MALTTEDQLEIQGLVARYNHAVDGGEGPAFAATFTPDGVLDAGHLVVEGHEALATFAAGLPTSFHAPRHITTNLVMEGDGDRATVRAYVQMYVLAGEPPRPELSVSGKYHDELEKVGDRWVFTRRVFVRDT